MRPILDNNELMENHIIFCKFKLFEQNNNLHWNIGTFHQLQYTGVSNLENQKNIHMILFNAQDCCLGSTSKNFTCTLVFNNIFFDK